MSSSRLRLGPDVPDLAALGAEGVEDLLEGPLVEEPRAQVLEEVSGARLLRCPLPGTPGPDGRLTASPRGAGTGWMRLRRYSCPGLGELFRSRFQNPVSLSPAEREWNLLCHLRQAGVSTPEPLAVAGAGAGLWSRHSVVVTREAESLVPLPEWLAEARGRRRSLGLEALGHVLARIAAARVELPHLVPNHLGLVEAPPEDCISETVQLLRAGARQRVRATPDLLVTEVRGGRIVPRGLAPGPLVEGLLECLPLSPRDQIRVARAALSPADLRAAAKRAGQA